MSLFTSTNFASAIAVGTDWRDTAKNILEKLESVKTNPQSFNFGFLYISDHLADDATSILNLFRSVMNIENWVGSIGMGVIGCNEAIVDQPAIAAMVGKFPKSSFCIFPQIDEFKNSNNINEQHKVKEWLTKTKPMLTIVHADPTAQQDPSIVLEQLERNSQAFIVGGLTSSRSKHYQIANNICENTLCGVFFSEELPVATTISQGCTPIGKQHTITRADDTTILELDDCKALEIFQNDLRESAAIKLSKDLKNFSTDLRSISASDIIPEEFLPLFQGQIHAALSDSLSDQRDILVRNIIGLNADNGSFSIAQTINKGDRLIFVQRTHETIVNDLTKSLIQLRERITAERGNFNPKAGLFFSCIARGFSNITNQNYETDIIREVIGEIPMAGFYAGGEISNARLYGYTGVLVLFF